jgi:hypothetical protein
MNLGSDKDVILTLKIGLINIYVSCANKRAKIKDVYGVNSCCVVLRKGSSFPFANAHVKGVVKMSKWTAT